MPVAHGKSAALILDGYDLTGYFREFSVEPSIAAHDSTVFGLNSKSKLPGLRDAKGSGDAFSDDTATVGSYDVLKAKYGAAAAAIISFFPQGWALGGRAVMLVAHEISFGLRNVVDDLQKLSLSFDAEQDAADFGVSLHALTAETAFPFNGTSVDNAASSANGGVGSVHVTAIAGAAPNVVYRVQHSTDNSVWADLITFSAITTANSSLRTEVAAATTVNRYIRTTITNGGTTTSVTGVVAFARR